MKQSKCTCHVLVHTVESENISKAMPNKLLKIMEFICEKTYFYVKEFWLIQSASAL